MTNEPEVGQPVSVLRRLFITLTYIIIIIAILAAVAYGFSSPECYANQGCDHVDQIIFAVVGVFDFILVFVLFIVGMKGWLPGARC